MRRIGDGLMRGLPLLLCVALLAVGVRYVPLSDWRMIGERAALVLTGLQRPREAVSYLKQTDLQEQSVTLPTVPTAVFPKSVPALSSPIIPPKGDGGGAVSEESVGGGVDVGAGIYVKNNSGVSYDYAALLAGGMPIKTASTDEPQVLIVHTHATECYMSYYAGYYNDDDPTRSTDTAQNVVAVGEVIAQELRAQGIGVIHDMTLHDSPQYTGAYGRAEETIEAYLQQYPSICMVLDIHRDAMMYDDLTKVKPTATVDGQKAAQVMLVVGATDTDELPNDHCEVNLQTALQLQAAMNDAYPDVMRPLYMVDARYNQGLLAGSLLIEVGTDANTLTEALLSGRMVGKQLAELLGNA